MEKCFLYLNLSSITTQFLDFFFHRIVFDLFFYCSTVETIYKLFLTLFYMQPHAFLVGFLIGSLFTHVPWEFTVAVSPQWVISFVTPCVPCEFPLAFTVGFPMHFFGHAHLFCGIVHTQFRLGSLCVPWAFPGVFICFYPWSHVYPLSPPQRLETFLDEILGPEFSHCGRERLALL